MQSRSRAESANTTALEMTPAQFGHLILRFRTEIFIYIYAVETPQVPPVGSKVPLSTGNKKLLVQIFEWPFLCRILSRWPPGLENAGKRLQKVVGLLSWIPLEILWRTLAEEHHARASEQKLLGQELGSEKMAKGRGRREKTRKYAKGKWENTWKHAPLQKREIDTGIYPLKKWGKNRKIN